MWRYKWNGKKWTKEPYQVSGYLAKSTDPRTWNTFQACYAAYQRGGFDGIGIVCANRLCGFDIDHCILPDGRWTESAIDIVMSLDSYSEITPSGRGIRVLFWGELPGGWRKNTELGIECYSTARYFTVTGQHMIGTPESPQERTDEAAKLHALYAPPEPTPQAQPSQICEARREDDDIIRIAGRAKNSDKVIALLRGDASSYSSASEADAALCAILAHYTRDAAQIDRIFKRSELYRADKWDARHYSNGATYGQMTIERALKLNGGAQ
jgi:primase-polymerase (primpol)-like protein